MANLKAYRQQHARHVLPVVLVSALAKALPPFSLFEERDAAMLELHLLLELFAVIVAILIAAVSWHDLGNKRNPESGILLAGFAVVAVLDLVHALTYDGMPTLVTESSTPRAIFFWLGGAALFWLGTWGLERVPVTFESGSGVTPFKRNYEYGLFLGYAALALLFVCRAKPENRRRSFAFASSWPWARSCSRTARRRRTS